MLKTTRTKNHRKCVHLIVCLAGKLVLRYEEKIASCMHRDEEHSEQLGPIIVSLCKFCNCMREETPTNSNHNIYWRQDETWISQDHALAKGVRHAVKYSQGHWFFLHKSAERELGRKMLKFQIYNWQHFSRKLQSNLLVQKACQRLVKLGRQGSGTCRKLCESAGYSTNYGGVSEQHCTHFNWLANKIDYRD